jgi:hypothetical protein
LSSSPLRHKRTKASITFAGEGKNLGSILPKVVTSHHNSNGKAIEQTIKILLSGLGMSSASRQKTVGRKLFDRLFWFIIIQNPKYQIIWLSLRKL